MKHVRRAPVADLMLDFQAVMEQFLDLQRMMLPAYRRSPSTVSTQRSSTSSGHRRAARPAPPALPAIEPAVVRAPVADASTEAGCRRYRVVAVDHPLPSAGAPIADGVLVISDDGRGVADETAARLRADGRQVVIVSLSGESNDSRFVSDLHAADDAQRLTAQIVDRHGPVSGFVHLMPLATEPAAETRRFFLLAQAMGAGLAHASARGGAVVIGCTQMGGALGCAGAATYYPPTRATQAGVHGFAKCLALEWPDVRVRAVDLDPSEPAAMLADHIVGELFAMDAAVEVGRTGARRITLQVGDAPAVLDPQFVLPSDAVVLATGGARGITADIGIEFARRCQPTLIVVGQSPLPGTEPADISGLTTTADLRRALTARLQAAGGRVTPAAVEKALRQVEKEREIRRNIGLLNAAGARVHYVQLDVRDEDAFGALIDDIYATYGRLDGVVHGAGIIEDKLVRDKTAESFDRVFQTKVASALVLSRRLKPESLKFLVFFSSVAGRFGNRGQADYAAANEVVSRLAVRLNDAWPARVCAIAWAPWDKHGMVSPELKREFERRGLALISPEAGRQACWAEIQQGSGADAEIVIGGATAASLSLSPDATVQLKVDAAAKAEPLPLLKHATRENAPGGVVRFSRILDVEIDRYLHDHRLDGRPVLPLAVATELMAEAAQAAWPDQEIVAIRNLQLFKGIALEDGPVPIVVTARASVHSSEDGLTQADVEITTPTQTPPVRYRCVAQLGARLPASSPFDAPAVRLTPLPLPLERAYDEWTFHGPVFQRVTQIAGIAPDAMLGTIFSSSGVPVIAGVARPAWIIDPFVFDAALQLLLFWSRATNDMTALPSRFAAFRRFGTLSDETLTAHVAIESSAGGHALRNDIAFVDGAGRLVAMLEGMEASCSAALNRLTARGGAPAQVQS